MNKNKKMPVKRLTELAMLTAAALIIFVIELRIPDLSPVPGVKLGLANIITVYCVYRYKPWETAMAVGVRVFLGAVFASTFTTILFSASGALLCLAGMIPVSRIFRKLPIWVCSIIGAVLHNIGQTVAAVVYMGSFAPALYLPVLIISGCIAGAFTGLCAHLTIDRIEKHRVNDTTKHR